MAFTRDMIEQEISERATRDQKPRSEVIEEMLKGATKGAEKAEREIEELKARIAAEGRVASNERQRVAILKKITKEEEAN